MNIASKLALMGATVVASGLMAAPAHATTEHCENQDGKVETSGEPTVQTNLTPGTTVCYKAGTQVGEAKVASDGTITSTILNKKGNGVLGVSYFVPGDGPSS